MNPANDEQIYIINPTSIMCECGKGIERGIFKTSRKMWKLIKNEISRQNITDFELECVDCGQSEAICGNVKTLFDACTLTKTINKKVFDTLNSDSLLRYFIIELEIEDD